MTPIRRGLIFFVIALGALMVFNSAAANQPAARIQISGRVVHTQELVIQCVKIQALTDNQPVPLLVQGDGQMPLRIKSCGTFIGKPAPTFQIDPGFEMVIQEYDISLVVFGKPAGEKIVFKISGLEEFAAEVDRETDAETMLV